jgi:hypothetical protein
VLSSGVEVRIALEKRSGCAFEAPAIYADIANMKPNVCAVPDAREPPN